jgi:hypothetical protein
MLTLAPATGVYAGRDRRPVEGLIAMPPVWLLDVDGVVNATDPGWRASPRRHLVWSATDDQSYLLRWAPALIERIRHLHTTGVLEVRWCSTWCPDAEELERLWGLPPLGRALTGRPVPKGQESWPLKLAAARAVLAADRPLVWTDDEALPPPGPGREELTAGGRALLIAPLASHGLQPQDLGRIEAFALRYGNGAA